MYKYLSCTSMPLDSRGLNTAKFRSSTYSSLLAPRHPSDKMKTKQPVFSCERVLLPRRFPTVIDDQTSDRPFGPRPPPATRCHSSTSSHFLPFFFRTDLIPFACYILIDSSIPHRDAETRTDATDGSPVQVLHGAYAVSCRAESRAALAPEGSRVLDIQCVREQG